MLITIAPKERKSHAEQNPLMEIVIIALATGMDISPRLIIFDLIFKYTICRVFLKYLNHSH